MNKWPDSMMMTTPWESRFAMTAQSTPLVRRSCIYERWKLIDIMRFVGEISSVTWVGKHSCRCRTPHNNTICHCLRVRLIIERWPTEDIATFATLIIHSCVIAFSFEDPYYNANHSVRPSARATLVVIALKSARNDRIVRFNAIAVVFAKFIIEAGFS